MRQKCVDAWFFMDFYILRHFSKRKKITIDTHNPCNRDMVTQKEFLCISRSYTISRMACMALKWKLLFFCYVYMLRRGKNVNNTLYLPYKRQYKKGPLVYVIDKIPGIINI